MVDSDRHPIAIMKMTSFAFIISLFSILLGTLAQDFPLPIPCNGPACANPPGELDYQDFSLIRRASDSTYFRFAKSNSSGHGLSVSTSPALRGPWSYNYEILLTLTEPYVTNRSDTDVWAPDVKFIDGLYYLFYSIHTNGFSDPIQTFDMAVATSETLEQDSWVDHGSMNVPVGIPPESYVRLDGNVIASADDPSGASQKYMAFGSYQYGLYGMELSDDWLRIRDGGVPQLLIADQPNPEPYTGNKTEGPFFLENEGFIYMIYSVSTTTNISEMSWLIECAGGKLLPRTHHRCH